MTVLLFSFSLQLCLMNTVFTNLIKTSVLLTELQDTTAMVQKEATVKGNGFFTLFLGKLFKYIFLMPDKYAKQILEQVKPAVDDLFNGNKKLLQQYLPQPLLTVIRELPYSVVQNSVIQCKHIFGRFANKIRMRHTALSKPLNDIFNFMDELYETDMKHKMLDDLNDFKRFPNVIRNSYQLVKNTIVDSILTPFFEMNSQNKRLVAEYLNKNVLQVYSHRENTSMHSRRQAGFQNFYFNDVLMNDYQGLTDNQYKFRDVDIQLQLNENTPYFRNNRSVYKTTSYKTPKNKVNHYTIQNGNMYTNIKLEENVNTTNKAYHSINSNDNLKTFNINDSLSTKSLPTNIKKLNFFDKNKKTHIRQGSSLNYNVKKNFWKQKHFSLATQKENVDTDIEAHKYVESTQNRQEEKHLNYFVSEENHNLVEQSDSFDPYAITHKLKTTTSKTEQSLLDQQTNSNDKLLQHIIEQANYTFHNKKIRILDHKPEIKRINKITTKSYEQFVRKRPKHHKKYPKHDDRVQHNKRKDKNKILYLNKDDSHFNIPIKIKDGKKVKRILHIVSVEVTDSEDKDKSHKKMSDIERDSVPSIIIKPNKKYLQKLFERQTKTNMPKYLNNQKKVDKQNHILLNQHKENYANVKITLVNNAVLSSKNLLNMQQTKAFAGRNLLGSNTIKTAVDSKPKLSFLNIQPNSVAQSSNQNKINPITGTSITTTLLPTNNVPNFQFYTTSLLSSFNALKNPQVTLTQPTTTTFSPISSSTNFYNKIYVIPQAELDNLYGISKSHVINHKRHSSKRKTFLKELHHLETKHHRNFKKFLHKLSKHEKKKSKHKKKLSKLQKYEQFAKRLMRKHVNHVHIHRRAKQDTESLKYKSVIEAIDDDDRSYFDNRSKTGLSPQVPVNSTCETILRSDNFKVLDYNENGDFKLIKPFRKEFNLFSSNNENEESNDDTSSGEKQMDEKRNNTLKSFLRDAFFQVVRKKTLNATPQEYEVSENKTYSDISRENNKKRMFLREAVIQVLSRRTLNTTGL